MLEITRTRDPDDSVTASGSPTASGGTRLWTGKDGLPIGALTGVAVGTDGWLWLATADGAIGFHPRAGEKLSKKFGWPRP